MADQAPTPKPKSALRASASAFVPSFLKPTAAPFVPSAPVKAPEPVPEMVAPSTPVAAAVIPASAAPSTPVKAEPEAESQPVASPVSVASTDDSSTSSEKEAVAPTPVVVAPEAVASPSRKRRISYTIAEMLAMEPELCPVPASLAGCIVLAAPGESKIARALYKQTKDEKPHGKSHHDRPKKGRKGKKHHAPPVEEDLSNVKPLSINEETRWKPKVARGNTDAATTEEYLQQVQAILNKLSVEKFDRLSDQLINVAVNSLDVLRGAIDMVVKKAQMEWHFSAMYAELCTKMARTDMPLVVTEEEAEGERNTAKLFRTLLLTRCQKEFEVTPLTSLNESDTDALSAEALAEKSLLLKRATLGHIRFIGELYKQGMLSSRIMHECIQRLFGNLDAPDEESLECLCKLISTVGARLDERAQAVPVEKTLMEQYFDLIAKLSVAKDKLCTRVRFMLQDLIDLRAAKYVSRIKEVKATTIAEIHAQVAREERSKAAGAPKPRGLQKSQSLAVPPPPSAPRRSNSSSITASDPDGWETIPSKPKMTKSISVPDNKRALGKNGPPPSGRDRTNDRGDRGARSRESRRGSVERPPRTPASSKGGFHRSSSLASLPSATSTPAPVVKAPEPAPEPAARSEEDVTKKAKSMLKEFAHEQDIAEVVASLPDALAHSEAVVTTVLNHGLEHSPAERAAVGPFLVGLSAANLLDAAAALRAIADLLEFLEDLEIDIPLAAKYLSEMVAPLVVAGVVAIGALDAPMAPLSTEKQTKLKGLLAAAIVALNAENLPADVQAFVAEIEA
ncbi:eukaryotic translation initiation factor [Achlya hypogyna]|uniref:Eukaryotic translation initiation factor n=1 Tax=Achlya hypogyna TaxID=1202772 RepID=A0A1V9ZAA3_ACHHY|nr:eukaryotic translation initiation factor [Achlya hypogyna]